MVYEWISLIRHPQVIQYQVGIMDIEHKFNEYIEAPKGLGYVLTQVMLEWIAMTTKFSNPHISSLKSVSDAYTTIGW